MMAEGRKFDICIECVHDLTKVLPERVASPFRIFVDEEGRIRDSMERLNIP